MTTFSAMPSKIVVDIIVAVVGALIYGLAPPKLDGLGIPLFFAGTLAALFAQ